MATVAQAQTLTMSKVARVNLQGDPGATYRVLYNTNLSTGDGWQTLRFVTADKGGQVSVVDESGETRFYRSEKVENVNPLSVMLNAEPWWAYLRDARDEIVASYSVSAGPAAMRLDSILINFDKRIWLYAKAISILDGTTVLASKYNLNASDFTELSVGTSYNLRLPIDFYQVGQNQTKQLAVLLHAYDVEDRPPTTLNVTRFQIRATDSATATMNVSAETDTPRIFLYNGLTGQVVATMNATSPLKRLVPISKTSVTESVLLAKFDLKSQNINGTLNHIVFGVNTTRASLRTLFDGFSLMVRGNSFSADEFMELDSLNGYVRFSYMTEQLPADEVVTLSVFGRVKPSTNGELDGAQATVSLTTSVSPVVTNNPEVTDGAFQPIDVAPAKLVANETIFSSIPVVVSGLSATSTPVISNNEVVAHAVQFRYTLTAGDEPIYVHNPTMVIINAGVGTIFGDVIKGVTPEEVPGDEPGYYVIPAGASRTFTISGSMTKVEGTGVGQHSVQISSIISGSSPANLIEYQITYGLEALKVEAVF